MLLKKLTLTRQLTKKTKFSIQQLIKDFRNTKYSREVIAIINMTTGQNDNARKLHVSPI